MPFSRDIKIPRFCRADILDSWYKPGGCHVEKFRLPSLAWACTPLSYDGSRYFLFTRNKIYLSRAKQGFTYMSFMYYIPESGRNGKEKKGEAGLTCLKKLLISIEYIVVCACKLKLTYFRRTYFSRGSMVLRGCLLLVCKVFH